MVEIETLAARDGTALLTRRWPVAGEPWATILVVHGLGEHSGRHDATAGRFAAAGMDAWSFDHRGFGASGGRRAYVERWAEYLDDIGDRLAASRQPGIPSAIYGHSLGGLLVADYLLDGRPLPEAAVLSAPAFGNAVSPLLRAAAPVLAAIAPGFELANPWDPSAISREPQPPVVAVPDPLSVHRTTAQLGNEIFRATGRVRERLTDQGGFPLPVLLVHGGADALVPTVSTERAGTYPSVERRVYPDVRHEAHHDPFDGERIVEEQIAWLRARLSPATMIGHD
jgi:acylglycerol lipase